MLASPCASPAKRRERKSAPAPSRALPENGRPTRKGQDPGEASPLARLSGNATRLRLIADVWPQHRLSLEEGLDLGRQRRALGFRGRQAELRDQALHRHEAAVLAV